MSFHSWLIFISHVPEYIAAAFAKRLSRLALIAPPNVIVMLLHFIGNLMVSCRFSTVNELCELFSHYLSLS
jgi:hypothetical protein